MRLTYSVPVHLSTGSVLTMRSRMKECGRMAKKRFYSEGIRFECQGSGKCCVSRGGYGYVYFSAADRRRMAAHLGIPTLRFTRTYCEKVDGWFRMKETGSDCVFLKNNRCSAYEGRPTQCRTWPFWPENMNARSWQKNVAEFCPGVGKGRLHSAEEIAAQVEADGRG